MASFCEPKWTSFRVNPLRCSIEDAQDELNEAGIALGNVAGCDHAFVVEPRFRQAITRSRLVESGGIHIQGLSSIMATLVLDPQPGEEILDLAAAPGGKATHMAALMNNLGWLSVVEPIRKRMFVLAENLKRAGVTISHTYLMDGRRVGKKVPMRFDRVMLDAPCSGESRFRSNDPKTWRFWSLRKIREQARKQQGLIASAFQALRPGGRMLYGTCSFAPEENEAIVNHLLHIYPDQASLVPIELPFQHWQPGLTHFEDWHCNEQIEHARRILPNHQFDGFFMALIEKQ